MEEIDDDEFVRKRCHTIAALGRLAVGNKNGEYAKRLLDFVSVFWIRYANGK